MDLQWQGAHGLPAKCSGSVYTIMHTSFFMEINKKRKNISDAQLKAELMKLFESGNTGMWGQSGTYGKIRERFTAAKDRFKKMYDIALKEWQELKEKATSEQVQANTIEQLKMAVMSKQERLEYLTKIAKAEIKVIKPFVISGKIMEYRMEPDATERMKAIAEINKMEGDYAPLKTEQNIEGLNVVVNIG